MLGMKLNIPEMLHVPVRRDCSQLSFSAVHHSAVLHICADPALTVNKVCFLLIPNFYKKTKQKGLHAGRISIFTA